MDYDLYHDESKTSGYWHGMLLVPRSTRNTFLAELQRIRTNTEFTGALSFKNLRKPSGPLFDCAQAWAQLGAGALIQNMKGRLLPLYTGSKPLKDRYATLRRVIGARFILFRVKHGLESLRGYSDYGARVETTFRMGLKGGLHLFAGADHTLAVRSFHFDGHEHHGRRIDVRRIVGRLGQLREEVEIPEDIMIDDGRSDHAAPGAQSYEDCQLLQLTDLLIGGFRTALTGEGGPAKTKLAFPFRGLVTSWHQGSARMRNSRWYKGYCISECWLDGDQWRFSNLQPRKAIGQRVLPGL